MGLTEGKEQNIGIKGLFRAYQTWNVLDIIELSGSLTSCLKLGCQNPNQIYSEFVDRFNKIYVATAIFINNVDLIIEVGEMMDSDWRYTNMDEFRTKAFTFLRLFNKYLIQLKVDGLYNPEIISTKQEFEDIWRESI